ncbi:hypothetical protein THRCLA_02216, partial [Thraustotheca clavata]
MAGGSKGKKAPTSTPAANTKSAKAPAASATAKSTPSKAPQPLLAPVAASAAPKSAAKNKAPKTESPKATKPAVVPITPELVAEKKTRLDALLAQKAKMTEESKAFEDELAKLLKTPKPRVQGTVAQLDEQAKSLEFKRNTVSMSLNEEKRLLKELDAIKQRKVDVGEYEEFQARVQTLKDKKKELFDNIRSTEAEQKDLQADVRKMLLALELNTTLDALVTISIHVPKDKMGMVIGKNYAKLRQLEETYHVLLDVDQGSQEVKSTSLPAQNKELEAAVNNIALATNHSLAMHPDTLKLLMIQKGMHLKALEAKCEVKIDVQRTENTITFQAAPDRARLVEKTIKSLSANKVTIDLPDDIIPKLIGKKGEVISKCMEETGALLDIDRVVNCVHIVGPADSVKAAKHFVEDLVRDQAAIPVNVHAKDVEFFGHWDTAKFPAFIEYLMNDKAAKLRELKKEALDIRLQVNKNKSMFEAIGNRGQIEALKSALQAAVATFTSSLRSLEVDDHCLSLIIGKKGSKIKSIEEASGAKVDIQGRVLYILGEPEQLDKATELIEEIVLKNQRSVIYTSSYMIGLLMNNKRSKLNEIEKSTECNIQLPQNNQSKNKTKGFTEIAITLTGTTNAIAQASAALEALNEEHKVVYMPLDEDEVAAVIGKKGETITNLEKESGCKLRVLDDAETGAKELELAGNSEQVAAAIAAVDALLHTSHRQLLNLDEFSIACLIGRKGERIKEVRAAHPNVTLDTFRHSQVVRVKGSTKVDVDACVSAVLELLQTSTVVETVKLPQNSRLNFNTLLAEPSVALYLTELEAQGGVKTTILENGTQVKLRGGALGIGKVKKFLDMLSEDHCTVSIPLPAAAHAASLKGTTESLHDNVVQVVKQTKTVIRIKADKSAPSGFVVSIEGSSLPKVLDAKQRIESLLQFFFSGHIKLLTGVTTTAIPRLFQMLPLLSSYNATLSLATNDSIKIFTDSDAHTNAVLKKLQETLKVLLTEYKELTIPGYIAPLLVGKNGDTIKRLSSESQATLTLSAADNEDPSAARVLTIHSRNESNVKAAVRLVQELIKTYEDECATVVVPLNLLEFALALKRQGAQNVSVTVKEKNETSATLKIHSKDSGERQATVERITEFVKNTVILHIPIPSPDMVGSIIGKSGANIKALQASHPGLKVDIRRGDKDNEQSKVTLRGDKEAVQAAASWVEEKIAAASVYHATHSQRHHHQAPESNAESTTETQEAVAEAPKQTRHVPVGAPVKLDKNARRRLRKRAEKEAAAPDAAKAGLSPRAHYGPKSDFATGFYHPSDSYTLH